MKRLNKYEILDFARHTHMSIQDATDVCEIFYREKANGNLRLKNAKLNDVSGYIDEWEASWFRYKTWAKLVQSEMEQGVYGYTEQECEDRLGESIFVLRSGVYIQTVL